MSVSRTIVFATAFVAASAACSSSPPVPKVVSNLSSKEAGLAICARGSAVVGGGYEIDPPFDRQLPVVVSNRPMENGVGEASGWKVECIDGSGKAVAGCRAYVICAALK